MSTTLEDLTAGRRRATRGEEHNLLRLGQAWIDKDGKWHAGQPDADTLAPAFVEVVDCPTVNRALRKANQAAAVLGELVSQLAAAEAAYTEAHRAARVAVAAEWSRRNIAPFNAAEDRRIREYFEHRARTKAIDI